MDTHKSILAIVLSFCILLGYQYLFVKPEVEQEQPVTEKTVEVQQPNISVQEPQPQSV